MVGLQLQLSYWKFERGVGNKAAWEAEEMEGRS
jgi:hypothetical protein